MRRLSLCVPICWSGWRTRFNREVMDEKKMQFGYNDTCVLFYCVLEVNKNIISSFVLSELLQSTYSLEVNCHLKQTAPQKLSWGLLCLGVLLVWLSFPFCIQCFPLSVCVLSPGCGFMLLSTCLKQWILSDLPISYICALQYINPALCTIFFRSSVCPSGIHTVTP